MNYLNNAQKFYQTSKLTERQIRKDYVKMINYSEKY